METIIMVIVTLNLVLNIIIISISSSWIFFNKRQNNTVTEDRDYAGEKTDEVKFIKKKTFAFKTVINGVEYKSEQEASKKLGIPRSTLHKWCQIYTQDALDKKVRLYLGLEEPEDKPEETEKRDYVRPDERVYENERTDDIRPKRKRYNGRLRVTNSIPPYIAKKYNLKPGDEFSDRQGFIKYTGGSNALSTNWIRSKWLEKVQ